MMDFSIFENGTKIYCSSVDDILEYREKLEFMAAFMPFEDVIASFEKFVLHNKTEEYYNIGGKNILIKNVTNPPFKLTICRDAQVVHEIGFVLPKEISNYSSEISNTPFNVEELIEKAKDLMTLPFANLFTFSENNWKYTIKK